MRKNSASSIRRRSCSDSSRLSRLAAACARAALSRAGDVGAAQLDGGLAADLRVNQPAPRHDRAQDIAHHPQEKALPLLKLAEGWAAGGFGGGAGGRFPARPGSASAGRRRRRSSFSAPARPPRPRLISSLGDRISQLSDASADQDRPRRGADWPPAPPGAPPAPPPS